jgi:hypothetical protein
MKLSLTSIYYLQGVKREECVGYTYMVASLTEVFRYILINVNQ